MEKPDCETLAGLIEYMAKRYPQRPAVTFNDQFGQHAVQIGIEHVDDRLGCIGRQEECHLLTGRSATARTTRKVFKSKFHCCPVKEHDVDLCKS